MNIQQLINELLKAPDKSMDVIIHTPRMDWYEHITLDYVQHEPGIEEAMLVIEASHHPDEGKFSTL
jgi:hypothetical protein